MRRSILLFHENHNGLVLDFNTQGVTDPCRTGNMRDFRQMGTHSGRTTETIGVAEKSPFATARTSSGVID